MGQTLSRFRSEREEKARRKRYVFTHSVSMKMRWILIGRIGGDWFENFLNLFLLKWLFLLEYFVA